MSFPTGHAVKFPAASYENPDVDTRFVAAFTLNETVGAAEFMENAMRSYQAEQFGEQFGRV